MNPRVPRLAMIVSESTERPKHRGYSIQSTHIGFADHAGEYKRLCVFRLQISQAFRHTCSAVHAQSRRHLTRMMAQRSIVILGFFQRGRCSRAKHEQHIPSNCSENSQTNPIDGSQPCTSKLYPVDLHRVCRCGRTTPRCVIFQICAAPVLIKLQLCHLGSDLSAAEYQQDYNSRLMRKYSCICVGESMIVCTQAQPMCC